VNEVERCPACGRTEPPPRPTGRGKVGYWHGDCPRCGADGPHPWWFDYDARRLDGYTCSTGDHGFTEDELRNRAASG
jgi:hypothetical protein